MNEGKIDLTRDDSGRDVGPSSRPSVIPDDHLQTTRTPPIAPRPLSASVMPPVPSIPPLPSFAPPGESGAPAASLEASSKPSWWRALLTATTSPPAAADGSALDDRALRWRAAASSAGLSLVFVLLALLVGLRTAPEAEPSVAAAVVLARAIVAVGLLAFAYALLRAAERLTGG